MKLRWRHRGKPHLPVESPMIRRNDARTAVHIAWFSFELVLAPFGIGIGNLCVSAFDDDFEPFARDGAKCAISIEQVQWLKAGVHELTSRKQITCRAPA